MIPGLRIQRHGESNTDIDAEKDTLIEKYGQNGPFVVDYYVYAAIAGADGEKIRLGPDDEAGPPPAGLFWFGKGKYQIQPPYEAGVFAGFRRKNREQLSSWDWEAVYARLDKRDRVDLRAWEYNYLRMPLSTLDEWTQRVAAADVIWIEGLEDASREQREEYVKETIRMWNALGHEYHGHGWVRNGLRSSFNLPPFQFYQQLTNKHGTWHLTWCPILTDLRHTSREIAR